MAKKRYTLEELDEGLKNENVQKFLRMIQHSEHDAYMRRDGDNYDPYTRGFGGKEISGLGQVRGNFTAKGKKQTSNASGAYQFTDNTARDIRDRLADIDLYSDFSPLAQDRSALALIKDKGAFEDIVNGDLESAIKKTNKVWASFDGSPYGQQTHSVDTLRGWYDNSQARLHNSTPRQYIQENPSIALQNRQALNRAVAQAYRENYPNNPEYSQQALEMSNPFSKGVLSYLGNIPQMVQPIINNQALQRGQ